MLQQIVLGVVLAASSETQDSALAGYRHDEDSALPSCWEIHSLGTLGGNFSVAVGLNNAGQVIGDAQTEPREFSNPDPFIPFVVAYLSEPDGGPLIELGGIGGFFSHADAINEAAQVAGHSTIGRSFPSAFISDPGGGNVRPTRFFSEPRDINNVGQTLFRDVGAPLSNPDGSFLGNNDGSDLIEILTPDSPFDTNPVAVNDRAQVAVNGKTFGYFWTAAGGARNLTPNAEASRLADINNKGEVIGVLRQGDVERAFITGPNGGRLRRIGRPGVSNEPAALNAFGNVVGTRIVDGTTHGYVTQRHGLPPSIDLDTLQAVIAGGWSKLSPSGINDSLQITGTGMLNQQPLAFLLTLLRNDAGPRFGFLRCLRQRHSLAECACFKAD